MATFLVVVTPFDGYETGDTISDPDVINAIRLGENSDHVRLVSDDPSPPTGFPTSPVSAEFLALKQMIADLNGTVGTLATALSGLVAEHAGMLAAINAQQMQLETQRVAILSLSAKVDSRPLPGGPPGDLTDDVMLSTVSGIVLATADGTLLAGSVR